MALALKALLGAVVVLLIALLAKTRNYYIAGLVPLFPTFALIAHYIVGSERGTADLKATVLFGLWAVLPYLGYLGSLYVLLDRLPLIPALGAATAVWLALAVLLVLGWGRWHGA
ncbi:GlpM family protein [Oryzomicrobium sp.]|uniref:GlpM family protein n=1 Tax=Oryzomicrobium sp. TaxID=1911578 RepID=UPI0025F6A522|nr:GlpM family protein [Oryzomicrobium sp.]MCE1242714.1 GlpM family protein [Oryzomicrobium sp.]